MNKIVFILTALLFLLPNLHAYPGIFVRYKYNDSAEWNMIHDIDNEAIPVYSDDDDLVISFSSDGRSWSDEIGVELFSRNNKPAPLMVEWIWEKRDGESYRYSINGSEWMDADDNPVRSSIKPNTISTFSIQSSKDGISWSEASRQAAAFLDRRNGYVPTLSIMASSMLRIASFYDGAPQNDGIGGLARAVLSFPISEGIAIALDADIGMLGYSGSLYTELSAEAKLRFSFPFRSMVYLMQIGGGESFVWNENRFAAYPMASIDLGFRRPFRSSLALEMMMGYFASFQRDGINHGIRLSLGISLDLGKEDTV